MPRRSLKTIRKKPAVALLAAFFAFTLWNVTSAAPASNCSGNDTRAVICAAFTGDITRQYAVSYESVAELRQFYAARAYEPAWSGSPAAAAQAKVALAELSHANDDGLNPTDYHTGDLIGTSPSTVTAAQFDILLSDGVMRYAHDLHSGRVAPFERDSDVSLPDRPFDAASGLAAAIASGTIDQFLKEQRPSEPQYIRLTAALAFYRTLAAKGAWDTIPDLAIKQQDTQSTARALLSRLAAEDPTVIVDQTAQVDPNALSTALSRFQARNGLKVDGRLGRDTLTVLNIPPEARVDTIEANLERWRWMPHTLESRYIMVNVPATELEVVDNGAVILTSRVVAGRPGWPSPIIRAEARGIVVNPPWNVPAKIARREIYPKLARHPSYLADHGMIVTNGHIEQLPGPKSALGAVKIDMPNAFSVYLHDTPSKNAFALDRRNLSHGCVRVQQIVPLASLVLTGDPDAGQAAVEAAVAQGTTREIFAPSTTTVYFAYWTAFVDDSGAIQFRPDIYGRDKRLLAALHGTQASRVTFAYRGCKTA